MSKTKFVGMRFVVVPGMKPLIMVEEDTSDGLLQISVNETFSRLPPMVAADALDKELTKLLDKKED
jgi:hypothetical protein